MRIFLLVALAVIVAGLEVLSTTFTPARLPVGEPVAFPIPAAHSPADMKLSALPAGKMLSQALFAYRGGHFSEPRVFGMGGILVQHPKGNLLFDTGFGRNVDQQVHTMPFLMKLLARYQKETPIADQFQAAGFDPKNLSGIVITHAHWDHVSGIPDFPGVPVWVNQAELDFIRSDTPMSALMRDFGALPYAVYDFRSGPYLGFERSHDVFGDGSVVLVPAPGHTPGSIIAFITLPTQQRYALVGDLVWQKEGIEIPAERPWISRKLVDGDEESVRELIVHMHQLQTAMPDLVIVPAHDRRMWVTLPAFGD